MSFEKDAVVLEKNKRLERILWGAGALIVAVTIAQAVISSFTPYLLWFLGVPLGLSMRIGWENWRARPRNARVRAGYEGVYVDGERVASAGDITTAVVQPRSGKKPTVRLRQKQRVIFEMVVEDEAEGVAFLRAIGHDAPTRKASFTTVSPLMATRRRSIATFAVYFGAMSTAMIALFGAGLPLFLATIVLATMVVLTVPLMIALRPCVLEVGADGLSSTWNRRRRFVPWDFVGAVETPAKDTVELTLESGEKLYFKSGGGAFDERRTLQRDALQRRILDAIEAHRGRIGPRELAARLMPPSNGGEWLADLKKLSEGEGGYRAAAVREDDLWRVVEDPGAPEQARAAAALLLRKADGAGPRLRIAADAVASPRLRVALEADEEEQAETALKAYLARSG